MGQEVYSLVQTNYYEDRLTIAGSATSLRATNLFSNHEVAGDNDLYPNGALPDGRRGQITAIHFKLLNRFAGTGPLAIALWKQAASIIESLWFTVYVSGTEHSTGPIQNFPHPPIWHSGLYTEAAGTSAAFGMVQNGGYMTFFQAIEISEDQRLKVVVESRNDFTAASTPVEVLCQIQCFDEKVA